jgi:hypothetical protein
MKLTTETECQINITEFKNSDVSLEQLFDAFKSHLIALTWSEEQINNFILELSEDLKK